MKNCIYYLIFVSIICFFIGCNEKQKCEQIINQKETQNIIEYFKKRSNCEIDIYKSGIALSVKDPNFKDIEMLNKITIYHSLFLEGKTITNSTLQQLKKIVKVNSLLLPNLNINGLALKDSNIEIKILNINKSKIDDETFIHFLKIKGIEHINANETPITEKLVDIILASNIRPASRIEISAENVNISQKKADEIRNNIPNLALHVPRRSKGPLDSRPIKP